MPNVETNVETSRNIPQSIREQILERDNHRCCKCGKAEAKNAAGRSNLDLHHILEFQNGGRHTPENLLTLCRKCHHAADYSYWIPGHLAAIQRAKERGDFLAAHPTELPDSSELFAAMRCLRVRELEDGPCWCRPTARVKDWSTHQHTFGCQYARKLFGRVYDRLPVHLRPKA